MNFGVVSGGRLNTLVFVVKLCSRRQFFPGLADVLLNPLPFERWVSEVQRTKGIDMQFSATFLSACALLALTACSTAPVSVPVAEAKPDFQAQITQFQDPKVNEAASAYVSHYKQTVEASLRSGTYQRELAVKYLNAESCFDSRASRLLSLIHI